jgi:hypothetical protein
MDVETDRLRTGFKVDHNLYDGAVIYMTGGRLSARSWFGHGEWTETVATIYMSGGTMTMYRGIGVGQNGYGYLYMTGGFLEILGTEEMDGIWIPGTSSAQDGHIQLDCGTIDTTKFMIRKNNNPGGTMDITEGTLIIQGPPERQDLVGRTLQDYIDNGWLTGYGDPCNLTVTYDADANETTVIAKSPPDSTATNPIPRCGTLEAAPNVTLGWTAGTSASDPGAHEVYLGTSYDDVDNATTSSAEYKGVQNLDANSYSAGGLELGLTYYWRIDEVDGAGGGARVRGRVWSFTVTEGKATEFRPGHGTWDVPLDIGFSWKPGPIAVKHEIYFAADFNAVNEATDPNVYPGRGRQDSNSYDPPETLEPFTRYYLRIDEVGGGVTIRGDIWSFMTTVGGTTVLRCDASNNQVNVKEGWTIITKDSWTSDEEAITWTDVSGTGIDITLDTGSGNDLSGNSYRRGDPLGRDFFFADGQDGAPDGDFIMKLNGLNAARYVLTTLHNNPVESVTLLSTVQVSGAATGAVPDVNVIQTQSLTDDALGHSQVSFHATGAGEVEVRYVCHASNDEQAYFNGFILNEFPPDTRYAHYPQPRHLATDVAPDVDLSWTPGDYAFWHDIYFGTSWDDVNSATTASGVYKDRQNLDANVYEPDPLTLNTTYYWRIDEVNSTGEVWNGNVWTFTVAGYLVVDDMESYDAISGGGNEIFDTWDDGFSNWTGAQLALEYGNDANVHGGGQSMRFSYNNTIGFLKYSEVDANTAGPRPGNLQIGRDWTIFEVKALMLFFYGKPGNDASQQMYAALEDGAENLVIAEYGDLGEDMNDITEADWHQWDIALSTFGDGGVILTDVNKVRIGFGDRVTPVAGGDGTVFFDDIQLYPPRCIPSIVKPQADLNDDCIVNFKDVERFADDWLKYGYGNVAATPPDGSKLALQYQFEQSSGSAISDDTGHGYDGTFFIDVNQIPAEISGRIEPGKSGNSFHFSTTIATGGISMPNDVFVDYSLSQEITVCMWIRNAHPNETPDGGAYMWEFRQWDGNSTEAGPRVLAVEVSDRGDTYRFRDDNDSVSYDHEWDDHTDWQHYAFVRDADYLKIYVDGVLEGQDNSSGNPMALPGLVLLGISADRAPNNPEGLHDGFTGNMDDFRIYSYALGYGDVVSLAEQSSVYDAVDSEANFYEPDSEEIIDLKDYAVLAVGWLEEILWPQ